MDYEVTKRGPGGEPTEIGCRAHAGCTWTLALRGPTRDDDPIFQAMFARHLEARLEPGRAAGGHQRRKRQ
jgi:hypothetical protein